MIQDEYNLHKVSMSIKHVNVCIYNNKYAVLPITIAVIIITTAGFLIPKIFNYSKCITLYWNLS